MTELEGRSKPLFRAKILNTKVCVYIVLTVAAGHVIIHHRAWAFKSGCDASCATEYEMKTPHMTAQTNVFGSYEWSVGSQISAWFGNTMGNTLTLVVVVP